MIQKRLGVFSVLLITALAGTFLIQDGTEAELELQQAQIVATPVIHKGPTTQTTKAEKAQVAQGVVFDDRNANGVQDSGEPGLAGVGVSNGLLVTRTTEDGKYELPVSDDTIIFVIKPSGWRTPINEMQLPRFFYNHKPKGSPKSRFKGVAPTGPLPNAINFALTRQEEPKQFQALMFGDPQPRNQQEIDYIAHDVIEELVGTEAKFGVTLGDIMFDNLSLFESSAKTVALLGIPWYNVIGNHDINRDAKKGHLSDETFERVFGPSYYSFDYGPAHFIALNNIDIVFNAAGKPTYRGGFGKKQLEFVKNDLALVPNDKLIVLMMHIPIIGTVDREALYRLIEDRPFTMSISGHTHHHEHVFIDAKGGWKGKQPHHHVINVTVSGSWWSGAKDERGIPHTIMADGAPNGYSILTVDENTYRVDFRAAGRSKDYQVQVDSPDSADKGKTGDVTISANVFNGSPKTKVELKVGPRDWTTMKRVLKTDPSLEKVVARENKLNPDGKKWRKLPQPKTCPHLWQANLPSDLDVGTYSLSIRATDRHGRKYQTHRILRVD